MNKQIQELAEKAGIETELDDYGEVRLCIAYGSSLEYFSSLLIKECMIAMEKYGAEYAYPSAGLHQAKGFSDAIKQHFGVTE